MSNPSSSKRASSSGSKPGASRSLNDYQLGDSLGKGAFGQVYRALKWATGEAVAIKEIQLSNIPKAELGEIMTEIDLLKNLNHPNIVKYKGFVKTAEYLYIILEFCENGSLHNICKRFGKFPETLVAVYISQVLEGLVYLHDQGVIHRDIKGANILTNKDGCVKLADFGVASSTTSGVSNDAVVGSPYWMAPEVIEQSGATTASDIWSVGCVVIELLEGRPPYHNLDPMPALFRIVQDDCPPIPEGASPIVKDFLYHCFQKDVNLRISARKLLRHPWMVSARKQMASSDDSTITSSDSGGAKAAGAADRRPLSNYNFDEAVLKVQEWNEALKSPARPSKHPNRNRNKVPAHPDSPTRSSFDAGGPLPLSFMPLSTSASSVASSNSSRKLSAASLKQPAIDLVQKIQPLAFVLRAEEEEEDDNWDNDFEGGISFRKLQALDKGAAEPEHHEADDTNAQTIKPNKSPGAHLKPLARAPADEIDPIVEDYSDIAFDEDEQNLQDKLNNFKMKNSFRKGLFHPDDIKIFANANVSPGPSTAPLPDFGFGESSKPRRPSLSPLAPAQGQAGPHSATTGSSGWPQRHLRSSSSTVFSHSGGSGTTSTPGSLGREEARRVNSEFGKYAEDDDEDYEDVFGKANGNAAEQPMQTLQLTTRLSNRSWLGDELSDEEDPFAEIDEGFSEEDLEANLQRDKHARLTTSVNQLIDELTPSAPNFQLRDACDQLLAIMTDTPEMQSQLVSSHGMLAILEVLEEHCSRDVAERLLQIINLLVTSHVGFLESFCLLGGIPVMMKFTSKKHPSECRLQASNFIRLLCHTSVLTLQMFISCRGLKVLVELLDEDYTDQADLVVHALNGICSVFELQSPTTKNDFCRMFIREGLLNPLSAALLNVMSSKGAPSADMKMKIIQILLVFAQVSQSDIHIRNALGTRQVIRRLLRACELLEPEFLVHLLKAVKHLSMNATLLDVLQNANAMEIVVRILEESGSGPHSTEISNHITQTCFNLCKLNKSRQEEAAQAGIVPCLKRLIQTSSPLRQFALPILCDLASAGKSCRSILWQNDGLGMYLGLLQDPYFQVSALESILSWLQEETSRVEDELLKVSSVDALLKCFVSSKANSFENLVDPLLKITRTSTPLTIALSSKSQFFKRLLDRLCNHGKAVVRLNLLRVLKGVCDVHPNKAILVDKYGLGSVVEKLSREDAAVLVRELAREIQPSLGGSLLKSRPKGRAETPGKVAIAPKKGPTKMRRTASESTSSAALHLRQNLRSEWSESPSNQNASPMTSVPPSSMSSSRKSSGTSSRGQRPRQKLETIPWPEPPSSLRG